MSKKFKNKLKKMKKVLSLLSMASVLMMTSCGNEEATEEVAAEPVVSMYSVNTAESSLTWTGSKTYAGYGHSGTIMFSEGTINTTDSEVTSASFTVDLNTMTTTDSIPEEKKGYLIGHLKSADFFAVDSLGSSVKLDVTSVENGMLKGSLTVMGVSKEVEIPVSIEVSGDMVAMSGDFEVNMAQFGVPMLQQPAEGAELTDEEKQNVYSPNVSFSVNVKATLNK